MSTGSALQTVPGVETGSGSEPRRRPRRPLERGSWAADTRSCCLGSPDCALLFVPGGLYFEDAKQAQALGIIACVLLSIERGEHDREGQVRAGTANLANSVASLQPNEF